MPRDYKRRASSSQRRGRQAPGWVWFLGGLLVGLFFSGLAWLKLLPPPEQTPQARVVTPSQRQEVRPRKEDEEHSSVPRPRFDFYTILPEMEVVVPEPEPEPERELPVTPPSSVARVKQQPSGKKEVYMLQMGSFHSYSDADRLKANLALVGIEAEIQRVRINGGDTFHRVRSGPYERDQVNRLRGRLKQNKINSLVIKLKQ
jgi:cell division protein FtsN